MRPDPERDHGSRNVDLTVIVLKAAVRKTGTCRWSPRSSALLRPRAPSSGGRRPRRLPCAACSKLRCRGGHGRQPGCWCAPGQTQTFVIFRAAGKASASPRASGIGEGSTSFRRAPGPFPCIRFWAAAVPDCGAGDYLGLHGPNSQTAGSLNHIAQPRVYRVCQLDRARTLRRCLARGLEAPTAASSISNTLVRDARVRQRAAQTSHLLTDQGFGLRGVGDGPGYAHSTGWAALARARTRCAPSRATIPAVVRTARRSNAAFTATTTPPGAELQDKVGLRNHRRLCPREGSTRAAGLGLVRRKLAGY